MATKKKLMKLEKRLHRTLDEVRDVLGKDAAEAFAMAWMKHLSSSTGVSKLPIITGELFRSAGFGVYRNDPDPAVEDDTGAVIFAERRREREMAERANPMVATAMVADWVTCDPLARKRLLNRIAEWGEMEAARGTDGASRDNAEACTAAATLLLGLATRDLLYAWHVVPGLALMALQSGFEHIHNSWRPLVQEEMNRRKKALPNTWKGWWIDTIRELLSEDYMNNRVVAEIQPPKAEVLANVEQHGSFTAIDVGVRRWGDSAHIAHLRSIRLSNSCLFVMGIGDAAEVYEAKAALPLSDKGYLVEMFSEEAASHMLPDGLVGLTLQYRGAVGELRAEHDKKEEEHAE